VTLLPPPSVRITDHTTPNHQMSPSLGSIVPSNAAHLPPKPRRVWVHNNLENALEGAVRLGPFTIHALAWTEVPYGRDKSGYPYPILTVSNAPVPNKRLLTTILDLVSTDGVKIYCSERTPSLMTRDDPLIVIVSYTRADICRAAAPLLLN
jgi:hypothetical protein